MRLRRRDVIISSLICWIATRSIRWRSGSARRSWNSSSIRGLQRRRQLRAEGSSSPCTAASRYRRVRRPVAGLDPAAAVDEARTLAGATTSPFVSQPSRFSVAGIRSGADRTARDGCAGIDIVEQLVPARPAGRARLPPGTRSSAPGEGRRGRPRGPDAVRPGAPGRPASSSTGRARPPTRPPSPAR